MVLKLLSDLKKKVQHFRKYTYLLSWREKIDTMLSIKSGNGERAAARLALSVVQKSAPEHTKTSDLCGQKTIKPKEFILFTSYAVV